MYKIKEFLRASIQKMFTQHPQQPLSLNFIIQSLYLTIPQMIKDNPPNPHVIDSKADQKQVMAYVQSSLQQALTLTKQQKFILGQPDILVYYQQFQKFLDDVFSNISNGQIIDFLYTQLGVEGIFQSVQKQQELFSIQMLLQLLKKRTQLGRKINIDTVIYKIFETYYPNKDQIQKFNNIDPRQLSRYNNILQNYLFQRQKQLKQAKTIQQKRNISNFWDTKFNQLKIQLFGDRRLKKVARDEIEQTWFKANIRQYRRKYKQMDQEQLRNIMSRDFNLNHQRINNKWLTNSQAQPILRTKYQMFIENIQKQIQRRRFISPSVVGKIGQLLDNQQQLNNFQQLRIMNDIIDFYQGIGQQPQFQRIQVLRESNYPLYQFITQLLVQKKKLEKTDINRYLNLVDRIKKQKAKYRIQGYKAPNYSDTKVTQIITQQQQSQPIDIKTAIEELQQIRQQQKKKLQLYNLRIAQAKRRGDIAIKKAQIEQQVNQEMKGMKLPKTYYYLQKGLKDRLRIGSKKHKQLRQIDKQIEFYQDFNNDHLQERDYARVYQIFRQIGIQIPDQILGLYQGNFIENTLIQKVMQQQARMRGWFFHPFANQVSFNNLFNAQEFRNLSSNDKPFVFLLHQVNHFIPVIYYPNNHNVIMYNSFFPQGQSRQTTKLKWIQKLKNSIIFENIKAILKLRGQKDPKLIYQQRAQQLQNECGAIAALIPFRQVEDLQIREEFIRLLTSNKLHSLPSNRKQFQKYIRHIYNMRKREKIGSQIRNIPQDTAIDTQQYGKVQNLYQRLSQLSKDIKQHHQFNSLYKMQMNQILIDMQQSINAKQLYSNTNRGRQMRAQQKRIQQMRIAFQATQRQYQASLVKVNQLMRKQQDLSNNLQIKMKMLQDLNKRQNNQQLIQKQQQRISQLNKVIQQIRKQFIILKPQNQMYRTQISQLTRQLNAVKGTDSRKISQLIKATQNQLASLQQQWRNKFNSMISQKQVQIQRQLLQQRRQSQLKYQDLINLLKQKEQQLNILKANPPSISNTHAQALYVYNQGLQKIKEMQRQRDNIILQSQMRLRAIQNLNNIHSQDIQRIKNQQILLVQQVQFAIQNNIDINRPGFDRINKWIKQLNQDKLRVQTQVQNFRLSQLQKYKKEIQFYKQKSQSRDIQIKNMINEKVQKQKSKLKDYYEKLIKAKEEKLKNLQSDKNSQIKQLKQTIQKSILQTALQKNKIIQDNKKSTLNLKLQNLNKQIVQLKSQLSKRQLQLNKMRFQAGEIVQIKKDKEIISRMEHSARDQIQQLQKKLNALQIQYQLKKNSQAKQSQQIKRITQENNLKVLVNKQLQAKIRQKQLQAAKTTQKIIQLNQQVKRANKNRQMAVRRYESAQQQIDLYEKAKSLMVSQGVGIQQAYAKLSQGSQTDHPLLQIYKLPEYNVQGRKLTISKLTNVEQRKVPPSTQLIQTQLQYKKMQQDQQKLRKQAKNSKQVLNNYKNKISKVYSILNDSSIKAQVRKKSIQALKQQIQIYKDDQLARMFQLSLDLKQQQELYYQLKAKNENDLKQLESIKIKANAQKQRLEKQLRQKNDQRQKQVSDIKWQYSSLQKKWIQQKQAHQRQIQQMKKKQKIASSILQAQIKRIQKQVQQDNSKIDHVTQYAKKLQRKMIEEQQKIQKQQKLLKQKQQLNMQITAQNKQYLQKYQKLKQQKRKIMIQKDKYLASRNEQQARLTALKQENNRQMKETLQQLKNSKQSANLLQKSIDSLRKTNLQLNISKQLSQKDKEQLKSNMQKRVKKMQSQSKILQENLEKQRSLLEKQKKKAISLQIELKESNRRSNEKFQQIIQQHKKQIERLKDIQQFSRASQMQARKNTLKLFKAQQYQYKAIIKNLQFHKTDDVQIQSTTQSKLKRFQRQLKQQVQKGQALSSQLKQLNRKLQIAQKKLQFQNNKLVVSKRQYQQLKQLSDRTNNILIPHILLQNQIYKNIFQIQHARKKIQSIKNLTMKNLHNENKEWRQKYQQMRKNQTKQMQQIYQQIQKATAQKMRGGNQTIMRIRKINLQNLLNVAKQRSDFYKKYFQQLQRLKVYSQQQQMPIQQLIRIEAQKIISQKVTQKLKTAIPQAFYQSQQGKRVLKQLEQAARKQKVSNQRIMNLNQQLKEKNRIIERLKVQIKKSQRQMQNIKQIQQWNQVQLNKNLTIQGKRQLKAIQTKMRLAKKMRNRLGYRTNAVYKNHILRQITRKMRFLGRLDISSNKSPQMLGLAMQSILEQLKPFYSSKISQGLIYGLAQRFLHITSYVKYIVAKNKKKKMFKTFFDIFLKKVSQLVLGVDMNVVQKNWQLYYSLFMNYDHSPILMHQGNRKQWNNRYKVHLNSWMQKMINKLNPGNLPLNSVSVQVNKSQQGQWQVQMAQLETLVGRIIGNIQMQYNAFQGVKPKQIQETGIDYTISIVLSNQNGNRITIPIRLKFLKQIDPNEVLQRIKKALKVILGKDQYQGFIQWFVEQIKFKNNIDLHTIVQDLFEGKIPQNIKDFLTYQTFEPHYNYLMYNNQYNYQLSCYENILVYIEKVQKVKLVRSQYGQLSYLQQLANRGYFGLIYKSLKLVQHPYLYCVVSACQRFDGVNLVKDHVFLTDKIVQWSNIIQQDKKMIMKPQYVRKSFKKPKQQPKYHKMYLDIQCFSDLYTRNRQEATIQQLYLIGVNYIIQDQEQDTVQFIIPQGIQPLAQRRQIMIRDFVNWFQKMILRNPQKWDVWAYNGINYDYQYIIPQLLQKVFSKAKVLGTKICPKAYLIKQGQLLVRFLDTKTVITTGSLKKNSQKYNKVYKKLQLNIAQISSEYLMRKYQNQILQYNKHDCLAMRQLLQSHYAQLWVYVQQCAKKYKRSKAVDKVQFYNKWTIPSMAFYLFQRVFLTSNILPDTKYFQIHKFNYFGGCTQVWKHITQHPLYQLDINSQYPSVMYQQQHPIYLYGQIQINSQSKLQQQIELIKKGFRDSYFYKIQYFQLYGLACTIGISTNKSLIYPKSYKWIQSQRQRWIWGIQLKPHLINGAVFIISKALAYRGVNQRGQRWQSFRNYVQQAYSYRLKAKEQKNDLMDNIAKCFQNSLYGKLAQKKFQKLQIQWNDGYDVHQSDQKQRQTFQVGKFVRMASYITSSARSKLTTFIYSAGVQNVWYMDTDSIYTNQEGYNNMKKQGLLHQKQLGLMKCQRRLSKAFFIAKKMYVGQVDYKWMYQNNYISKEYYLKNQLLRWSMKSKGINVNQSQTDIQLLYIKATQMYKLARWIWLQKPSLSKVICIMKFDTILWQKQKNQRYGVKRMLVNKKVNFIFQRQPLQNGQTIALDYDFVRQIIKNKSKITQDQFRSIPYQYIHLFEQLN